MSPFLSQLRALAEGALVGEGSIVRPGDQHHAAVSAYMTAARPSCVLALVDALAAAEGMREALLRRTADGITICRVCNAAWSGPATITHTLGCEAAAAIASFAAAIGRVGE